MRAGCASITRGLSDRAPVAPVAGGGLRIEVNNQRIKAGLFGGDGKGERKCGFAGAAFLGYEGNSFHEKYTCI